MGSRADIVLFQPSDGLDPIVIQKLNRNFTRLGYGDRRLGVMLSDGISGVLDDVRYENLPDKPSIESVTLVGDKTFPELNIFIDPDDDPVTEHPDSDDYALTSSEITALWNAAS